MKNTKIKVFELVAPAAKTPLNDKFQTMEGFDPKKFDEILGLDTYGVESRAIVTLGFRSEGDTLPKMAKVRFPKSEVVVEVK